MAPLGVSAAPALISRSALLRAIEAAWASGASLVQLYGPPGVGKSALAAQLGEDVTVLEALTPDRLATLSGRCLFVTRDGSPLGPGVTRVEVRPLETGPTEGGLSPAAELLCDAARRHAPSSPALAPALAEEVAGLLDGLPFALEEVGARVALLNVDDLLEGLRQGRLDPLTHARVQALIRPSLMELDDNSRHALRCLAVFEGDFAAEDALAILEPLPAFESLTCLQTLHRHSLLLARGGEATPRTLRVLRPFRATLEPPADARRRHAARVAEMGRHHAARSRGVEAASARAWGRRAEADLLSALRFTLAHPQDAQLAAALADLLEALGALLPGWSLEADEVERCRRALLSAPPEGATRGSLALGERVLLSGRLRLAEALYLDAMGTSADLQGEGRARTGLAAVLAQRGHTEPALAEYDRALACLRAPEALAWRGRAKAWRGLALLDAGEAEAGAAQMRRALLDLERADDRVGVAVHRANLGLAYFRRGEFDAARRLLTQALAAAEVTGDLRFQAAILSNLGGVEQDTGRFDAAARTYAKVRPAMERVVDLRTRYALTFGHAAASHAVGAYDEAERLYLQARQLAWRMEDSEREAECEGFLATLQSEMGLLEEATARLTRAKALCAAAPPRLTAAMELLEALVELSRWRAQLEAGELGSAKVTLKAAQGRLRAGRLPAGRPSLARRAAALLERACVRVEAELSGAGATTPRPPADLGALVVERGALGVWLPSGEHVDLRRSRLKRRLLLALVDARLGRPGEPLDTATLWRAGWGDERALESAQRNRIYVAVASLRALGLHDALVHTSGGYMLAPTLEVRLTKAP